jgi:hypothetical protein
VSDLVIDHGNPWWLSQSVWVALATTPGEGPPGEQNPVVGEQYLATATVNSLAATGVQNGTVYFFWADPSLSITTMNAHAIGSSPVTVNAGSSAPAQCTTPWVPSLLPNGSGHECLVAAVVEDTAPGQVGPPPANLNGDTDPTVGQHNLGVVTMSPHQQGQFIYPFQIFNGERVERAFEIVAEPAPLEEARPFLRGLPGGEGILKEPGKLGRFGIVTKPRPAPEECERPERSVPDLKLGPHEKTWFSVVGALEGGAALIHVTQRLDGRVIGGLSVLVVPEVKKER